MSATRKRLTALFVLLCASGAANVLAQSAAPLIANLQVDRTVAHVNEQILITLRVGAPAQAFAVKGEALNIIDAKLVSLSRRDEEQTVDGIPYRFTESRFALFAEASGKITVPAIAYRATMPVSSGGTGNRSNPRIEARTEPVEIRIDSPPTDRAGVWLPAQNITLSTEALDRPRVGEPFTRVLYIDVQSQHPAAIPALDTPVVESLRFYPEQARLEERTAEDGMHGRRVESTVIVASSAGTITLPAVKLAWWDIVSRDWQTAQLPAEDIVIDPALNANDESTNWHQERARYRIALTSAFVLCLALAAMCLYLRRHRPPSNEPLNNERITEREAWASLIRALRGNDPRTARQTLQRWRRSLSATSEAGLAAEPEIEHQLRRLDEYLYQPGTSDPPDLTSLRRVLSPYRRRERKARGEISDRIKLYPTRSSRAH